MATASAKRRGWLRWLLIVVATLFVVQVFWLETFVVTSNSMALAYQVGDRVLVNKLAYVWRSPARWEVVVFRGPEGKPYIKRVVGLPNETVQIVEGEIMINGDICPKPEELSGVSYKSEGRHAIRPYRLDDNEFFLLGDNSEQSHDSRNWPEPGVERSALIGRPIGASRR